MQTFHFNAGGFNSGNFNENGINIDYEFEKICTAHPGCIDCPLKTQSKDYGGAKLICITDRNRR